MLIRIAFRNIFRHWRRSALTGMMMAGAFALFSLTFGFVDGGYDMMIDMFTRDRTGHVQIHAKGFLDKKSLYKQIREVEAIGRIAEEAADIDAWSPRVYGPGLAFAGTKTTGLAIMGIDPLREPQVTRIKKKVNVGDFISDTPIDYEIILPIRAARVLKVDLGDQIALISQAADGSMANALFRITGIIDDENGSYGDTTAFTHIDTAREFFVLGDSAHEIAIVLKNHWLSRRAANEINLALKDSEYEAAPWQVVEDQFYRAMQADLKGHFISLAVLTVIVAVGVLNTVLMVILERKREYGVMKAIGTTPAQIFKLIVLETMILALISVAVGTVGGLAANTYFSIHGITYPEPIEWGGIIIENIKSHITPRTIWMPMIVILTTAFIVSLWPAFRAARVVPVKSLREG